MVIGNAACAAQTGASKDRRGQVDGTAFEFSSSGEDLTVEHGAWIVRVRGDAMWVAWIKAGKTREYGTFQLSGKDSDRLWTLIEAARLAKRRPGKGVAAETPVYSFTLLRPKRLSHTVTVKAKDAERDDTLRPLVAQLAKLVKKYAKKKPRLSLDE